MCIRLKLQSDALFFSSHILQITKLFVTVRFWLKAYVTSFYFLGHILESIMLVLYRYTKSLLQYGPAPVVWTTSRSNVKLKIKRTLIVNVFCSAWISCPSYNMLHFQFFIVFMSWIETLYVPIKIFCANTIKSTWRTSDLRSLTRPPISNWTNSHYSSMQNLQNNDAQLSPMPSTCLNKANTVQMNSPAKCMWMFLLSQTINHAFMTSLQKSFMII